MEQWTFRYMGIAVISTSSIMLQVAYTRVFSLALWYHFVWMIVSIALLGLAMSGTFMMMFPAVSKINLDKTLLISSFFFSISILVTYLASNMVPFDPVTLAWDNIQLLYILLYYGLLSIPFFLSGLTTALAIEKAGDRVNIVYFYSFLGSAIGSIFVLPFFRYLGGSGVIILISIIGSLAAILFAFNLKKGSRIVIGWIILLIILLPLSSSIIPEKISPYMSLNVALRYQNAELLDTRWNSFSRVDVVESGFIRFAPGLSLFYNGSLPPQIGVIVDGSEVNAITRFTGGFSNISFVNYLPSYLPYHLSSNPKVLVVDAGGGIGVLTALYGNASRIYVSEENPTIIDLVKGTYSTFSGNIYDESRVEIEVSDGRSYIQKSMDEYDVIDLSLTGGTSPSSTGLYALSENYLYTTDSFTSFYEHLSSDGMLSIQRRLLPPPREDIRVVGLVLTALEDMGVPDPEKHIVVYRSWGTLNLIVGKNPLSQDRISAVRNFCSRRGFDIVYVPDIDPKEANKYNRFPEPIYYNIVIEMINNREEFYKNYLFDISPTTDEKPFFFNFFKWNRLAETYENLENRWQPLIEGGLIVPLVLLQTVVLSALFILLPLRRVDKTALRENIRPLCYFFLIGIGYMFIEITTIQRFILILGNAIYSISAVFFCLLISSGLGSYYSGKINPGRQSHAKILGFIGAVSIFYGLVSSKTYLILGFSFSLRVLITVLIICPLGFLMGMPFPLGIRQLSYSKKEIIGWAWAVNGCASVIGSIAPVIIALYFGFSKIYLLAGLSYIVSMTIVFRNTTIP